MYWQGVFSVVMESVKGGVVECARGSAAESVKGGAVEGVAGRVVLVSCRVLRLVLWRVQRHCLQQ